MQGYSGWSYKPYMELDKIHMAEWPYIAALRPGDGQCLVEWDDNGKGVAYTLEITDEEGRCNTVPLTEKNQTVPLTNGVTYTFQVTEGERKSELRRALIAPVVGTVVNYLHPKDTCYAYSGYSVCSPSLIRLGDGRLLCSTDVYRCRGGQNLSKIFESKDDGTTWQFVTDLFPCFWGKLFEHKGELYMLASTTEYGFLIIGKSTDGGRTWPGFVPLFPGSGNRDGGGPHKAPLNILPYKGRLWTAIDFGTWEKDGHANAVLSIGEDEDLLTPENWKLTPFLPFDDTWPGAARGESKKCLEGNMAVLPDGRLVNFIRYQIQMCTPTHDRAVRLAVDTENPEAPLTLDRVIDFPGGISKFSLLFDDVSGYYLALVNRVTDPEKPMSRDVLSLTKSKDALHWEFVTDLLDLSPFGDGTKIGAQYPDAIIDGEDILWTQRTAMNQASNFHDSNYITFHRLSGFRKLL